MAFSGIAKCDLRAARSELGCGSVPRAVGCQVQEVRGARMSRRISARQVSKVSARKIVASAAASEGTDVAGQPETTVKDWYAVVANAEFMLNDVQNEPLAEQLREKTRFFAEQSKEIDFFVVPEPQWLDKKYPKEAKMVGRPCVALVSTDKVWITFMKLRLDRVLKFDLGPMTAEEALAVGGEIPPFEKPATWTAPYSKYAPGWWEVFLPPTTENST